MYVGLHHSTAIAITDKLLIKYKHIMYHWLHYKSAETEKQSKFFENNEYSIR